MSFDPDFSKFQLKVNAAGSWANVGSFDVGDEEGVKAACLTLAEKSKGRVKFKTMDAAGGNLEMLSYAIAGGLQWRKSRT